MQIRINKVELIIGAHNDPSANDEHFGDADNTDVFNIEFTMWHDGQVWNRYAYTRVITRHKCLDGKTRSLAINGLEGFIEYIHNIDLPLLWPVSGPRTCWEKRAVPKDGIVYFRANNYREDEEKFFNEYLWWIMAYYAKGEPMDMIDATVLAKSLADHLVIGAFK